MNNIDTQIKVKSISNTKLAIATAFLGLSAVAAAVAGSSTDPTGCFKNSECEQLYDSCFSVECKNNSGDISCKNQCLRDAISKSKIYASGYVCGNGVIEQGEICDENNETCLQNCTIKLYSTSPGATYSNTGDINFLVTDQNGVPIRNAHIKLYPFDQDNPSSFPLGEFTTDLQLEGYTNPQGSLSIPFDIVKSVSSLSQIIVQKNGYVGAMWRVANLDNSIKSGEVISFVLNKIPDQSIGLRGLAPVFVVSDLKLRPYLERVNRTTTHVVVPRVRDDLMNGVDKVDLTMHIVGLQNQWKTFQGTPVFSNSFLVLPTDGSKETHLVLKKENIQLGNHYSFDIKLEYPGMYYSFFEFTLYKGANLRNYYYFPQAINLGDEFPEWVKSLMDQYGYSTFPKSLYVENTEFAVFDNPKEDVSFDEVLPGHNQVDDSRINVVFFGTGFEQQDFVEAVKFITADDYLSLTSVYPFLNNKNSFNYWYYPNNLTPEQATWPFGDTSNILSGFKPMTYVQELATKHTLNGKTVLVLLVNDETLSSDMKTVAASGKCKFQRGIIIAVNKNLFTEYRKTKTFKQTFLDLDFGRVALHEFGHEIGLLGEEYYNSQKLFDNAIYKKENVVSYNPAFRPNSYYTFRDYAKECYKMKYASSINIGIYNLSWAVDDIICKVGTNESCQSAPWSNLIGNGCGVDGVIDCSFKDSDFYKEVGCYSGGGQGGGEKSKPDLFKPTFSSIMEFGGKFNAFYSNDKHPYGLFNERVICDDIEMYTGKKCID